MIVILEKGVNHGIILLVDFEKAFNKVEWSFIEKTLVFMGLRINFNLVNEDKTSENYAEKWKACKPFSIYDHTEAWKNHC